jgi:hypothetical protein
MKVSFKIDSLATAETAVAQCALLAETYRRDQPKTAAIESIESDEAPAPVAPKRRGSKQAAPAAEQTMPGSAIDQPSAVDPEARAKLTAMARERGIIWAREILGKYNAAKLSDLLDDEVAEILAA